MDDYRKNFLVGEDAVKALEEYDDTEDHLYDRVRVVIHLKQRMAERALTQMQLSEMSGVRQATISQLSRGYVERLHIPTLEKIAWALGIEDITQLITFELESEIMNMANPYGIEYDYPTKNKRKNSATRPEG
ncbi:putative XRE-type DNA-binding protein [Bacillus thermophilus]|uniref:XRE-type DNA-binding protein n=1 Tax=Siminovitchia thermophila TaxID=1245522 RepID=A0ABS2R067_9BACI|nr:helix-turn-helix transcriptional regulator [Siminovitchia thermophila]MBM7713037.1 putative XRE-type DNA-binding protein [Siminovitchia thermophila]